MATYGFDQKPKTEFSIEARVCLDELSTKEYAVLVGRNNCGKSFILKTLTEQLGRKASYIGPARYQNFNLLGSYSPRSRHKDQRWNEFLQQWRNETQNIDNSPLNLQQAIAELSDSSREHLREIVKLLLGTTLDIVHTVPDNSMSQKYISCGGHNLSYTSSGFRLITTLITCLLDTAYETVLIDEPELGISPEAQGVVADFLFDREHRKKYFSHIKNVIFATHSSVFLDRKVIDNNYSVEKHGDVISISKVTNLSALNGVHFFLLGNRFETLYLPSLILIVEGKSDHKFIRRVLSQRYPTYQFSVIHANTDSRIKEVVSIAKDLLNDIQKSPYKDRIVVVLDAVTSTGLKSTLVDMGVLPDNVVQWSKNGIEYVYPSSILDSIYGPGGELMIFGDLVSRNGISYKKDVLAERVVSDINRDTTLASEFESRLISVVERRLGLRE